MWGWGIEEGGRGGNKFKKIGRWKTLTWSVEEKNRKKDVYFVCDFNVKWLKDSTFLCCIDVLLSVEGELFW